MFEHQFEYDGRSGVALLDDTALLCESSHHDVHHGRTLRLKDGRRFNADGWID